MIELIQRGVVHTVELFPRQGGQQLPPEIQCLVDGAVFIFALVGVDLVEQAAKLQQLFVAGGQFFLTDNRGERAGILHPRIAGEQLVGYRRMVRTGEALADAVLHQPRQRRQHRHRRINAAVVE